MTPELVKAVRKRQKLHKTWKKHNRHIDEVAYKKYRILISKKIHTAKDEYYKTLLQHHENNPRMAWNTVNRFFRNGKNTMKQTIQHTGKTHDEIIDYFTDNASSLVRSHIGVVLPTADLPVYNTVDFTGFQLPSMEEVQSIINELDLSKAPGGDDIPVQMFKQNPIQFAILSSHLLKAMFTTSKYPKLLKEAVLFPIHKSGSIKLLTNYRPISLLPVFNKIIERTIEQQLREHIETQGILHEHQYGFRAGRSCVQAAQVLMEEVIDADKQGEFCLLSFLDLRSAFDTVNIPRLLQKLEAVGIKNNDLSLISSYLSDRTLRYRDNEGEFSGRRTISIGVPQGSLLSPLLYTIYSNDLLTQTHSVKTVAFADDLVQISRSRDLEKLKMNTQQTLHNTMKWLHKNGLILNLKKTKYIIFNKGSIPNDTKITGHSHNCPSANSNHQICGCPEIERVSEFKYLGLIIDEKLKFKSHIHHVCQKAQAGLAILYRLKKLASVKLKRSLYFALIQSHVEYMLAIYGGSLKTNLEPIKRLQKKAIRLVRGAPWFAHTKPIFEKLGILKLEHLYAKNVLFTNYAKTNQLQRPTHDHHTRYRQQGFLSPQVIKKTKYTADPILNYHKIFNQLPTKQKDILMNSLVLRPNYIKKEIKLYLKSDPPDLDI